jgi:hypothetical protein
LASWKRGAIILPPNGKNEHVDELILKNKKGTLLDAVQIPGGLMPFGKSATFLIIRVQLYLILELLLIPKHA